MKKISWGTGIVIAFIIFTGFTLVTTIYLMNQDVDLVADDYYDQEIKYQDHIDKVEKTNLLGNNVIFQLEGTVIKVQFSDSLMMNKISGTFYFYRPSNAKKDFEIPLQLSDSGLQIIPINRLDKGYWKVKFNWTIGDELYYKELNIQVN